ncbi:MAG TPA: endolytic transglycosylase MltG [Candidatus Eisenbacteria bacterium]|nr:endolytic transglycosylase MltG [Candidatus Eisenbacteria bacterium]
MRKVVWLFIIAGFAVAGWLAWALVSPVEPSGQTFVMLRPGYSTRRIATELQHAGVIRSKEAFILWHYYHHGRSLKAGEYLFDKPANIIDIQKRLRRGDVYFHTVVVPEGFTMFDIAHAIEAAGLGSADDFIKVAKSDTELIADIAPNATSLEGYLFPDTYEFSRMMTMQEVAADMVCQFRVVAKEIGLITAEPGSTALESVSKRSGRLCGPVIMPMKNEVDSPSSIRVEELTLLERTVIMASIVEKETAVPEERPEVASVYYNRLAKHIALDADPSIIYAELLAGTYQGALHHADMSFTSAYNTYRNAGLPPGPIANPGRSALEAAIHPAQTDYYYFVADAQGHHRFARTMEEHNKNVIAYRKALRGH